MERNHRHIQLESKTYDRAEERLSILAPAGGANGFEVIAGNLQFLLTKSVRIRWFGVLDLEWVPGPDIRT